MKVLHVIGPMTTGGAQTQLLGLLSAAHGKLWDATVVATSPGEMTARFEGAGIPVHELRRLGSPGLWRIAKLRGIIRRTRPEVVHSNLWQANLFSRLAVIGRPSRPGMVISERGVDVDRSLLHRRFDRALRPATDIWVGNSDAVVAFILDAHGAPAERTIALPNAIDRAVFAPVDRSSHKGPLVVGVVGRLTWEKGHEVLIEAIRRLSDDGFAVEARLVGDGPRRRELTALAEGLPVTFLGALPAGEQIAEFLAEIDVFVLPSHVEGRPNAILEALATATPTIVSDAPGCLEAVGEGGRVFPRGDADALADALRQVGDDGTARERAVAASRTLAGFDDLARSYLSLFEDAAARRLPTPSA